jgi:hypothetical protein
MFGMVKLLKSVKIVLVVFSFSGAGLSSDYGNTVGQRPIVFGKNNIVQISAMFKVQ